MALWIDSPTPPVKSAALPGDMTQEDWDNVRDLVLSEAKGKCRVCGTEEYTVKELNISIDQVDICYRCLDEQRCVWPDMIE